MIITDPKPAAAAEQPNVELAAPKVEPDHPPDYTPSSSSTSPLQSADSNTSFVRPPGKPSNFLSVIRKHQSIKGTFLLDPSLRVPSALLPPESEGGRKNLTLASHLGSIDVEIYLDPDSNPNEGSSIVRKPTTIDIQSFYGHINAKLYAPDLAHRSPCHLSIIARHRGLTLHLPRSFNGPLIITCVHRSSSMSEQLSKHVTSFGEIGSTRKCFVGDLSGWGDEREGNDAWKGDEAVVYSETGKVKLQFVDEIYETPPRSKGRVARLVGS